ncbi:hypothetical protein CF326_g9623 [Tilletia indica]|uniref:Integrase catalytic domain-containing protein n=1 Tax=Tilletia indica TaxID=43049 RepID=A0A8T8SKE5_9BASI|nr:hypothetical protein CF326_g9623 [Tilletia indica]KAE8241049.1 hypothetical protein A4X13_0g7587 [Tilletia indica]
MVENRIVKGLQDLSLADIEALIKEASRCDVWIVANQKQASYPSEADTKVHRRLERVLCDIMGPFEGHDVYLYILTLVDEWSRKTWAIPLRDRTADTIIQQLTIWAAQVETQSKERLTSVHTDNAKEFTAQDTQVSRLGEKQRSLVDMDSSILVPTKRHCGTSQWTHPREGTSDADSSSVAKVILAVCIRICYIHPQPDYIHGNQ